MPATPTRVGILAYDGCFAAEVFGLADLFVMADLLAAATGGGGSAAGSGFAATVLGRDEAVTAAGGHRLQVAPLDTPVDAVVVPGFAVASRAAIEEQVAGMAPEVAALQGLAGRGTPVASVCVGAFVLGRAELLDGRRATTSWLFADLLQQRHPRAIVDRDAMVVSDGALTTTAAFSAVHDLALRFVRAAAGDTLARQVARMALVADNRHSQAPYVDEGLLGRDEDVLVRDVQRWLVAHLDEPYDLARVAGAVHVSTRTLLRRFSRATGGTPLGYLQGARIGAAKRLLEAPDHTVASAMHAVGYHDRAAFRRLFARHTGMTPGVYRAQFASSGQDGPDGPDGTDAPEGDAGDP